ncbi:class I SAM-dependent methyltransferase [Rhodohalobacter sp.]|uniref:class I SAM-dependent methyltransferase n=1 Tax=Rhodohalobacter sp. TaxID=1974210 RepID=UPI002ACDC503|nr:methyltransferase domain-containing protein [Rhodohalobacter sp.]MDZ7758135.1 methyltransferase domain-containing protein [Rhodohalobacter sp.]
MEPQLQRRVQRYGWNKAAEFYDKSWEDQLKPAQDKVLEMINLQPGEVVLETSCGTGLVTFRAAKGVGKDGKIVATDLSEVMVDIARKESEKLKIDNITFHRMDAEQLQFNEELFDKAICCLGLMYFPYPLKGLKEMHRLLKPGGTAAVSIWGERKNCGWAEIFPIVDRQVASDVCPLFFQQGTGNALQTTFQEAGFNDVEVHRFKVKLNYTDSKTALMAAFAGGPVALAYQKFDAETRDIVHGEYLESIEPYKNGAGYKIPGEFVVAKGVK